MLTITRNIIGYYEDCKWITGKKSEFCELIIFPKSKSCLQNKIREAFCKKYVFLFRGFNPVKN